MSESDNLLEKIKKKRTRTTVPERVDPLIPQTDTPDGNVKVESNEDSQTIETNSVDRAIAELNKELDSYPPTTRRSAIVIESKIERELKNFCDDHKITVEVFLEAAWQITKDSETINEIIDEAQIRYRNRKEVGRLKRLITQLSNQKFKS